MGAQSYEGYLRFISKMWIGSYSSCHRQEAAGSQSDDYSLCASWTKPLWDGGGWRANSSSSRKTQRDSAATSQRGRPPWKQEKGK